MTSREFIAWVSALPSWVILAVFVAPPAGVKLLGYGHGPENGSASPWKYAYALLVYWVCIPGVLVAVVAAYMLFFTSENFLDQNILIYILPVASMVVTLVWIKKNVAFDDIPGFDRLSGLIVVIVVTFMLVLAIHKTRLWLVFGGSIFILASVVLGLIGLLQWGLYTLLRRPGEPKRTPPHLHPPNDESS